MSWVWAGQNYFSIIAIHNILVLHQRVEQQPIIDPRVGCHLDVELLRKQLRKGMPEASLIVK